MSQVITASRLVDGVVVFKGPDGVWVERLDRAVLLETKPEAAAALEQAKADEAGNLVVDTYLIDVSTSSGGVVPTKIREAIRARGPTVHPEFAKPGVGAPVVREDDHVSV